MKAKTWTVTRAVRVIDGDTVVLSVERVLDDDGERQAIERHYAMRVRLVTLDTPERGEVGWGEASRDVVEWLSGHGPGELSVETYGRESLGRFLGDVYVSTDRTATLSQWMLRERGWTPWVKQ